MHRIYTLSTGVHTHQALGAPKITTTTQIDNPLCPTTRSQRIIHLAVLYTPQGVLAGRYGRHRTRENTVYSRTL